MFSNLSKMGSINVNGSQAIHNGNVANTITINRLSNDTMSYNERKGDYTYYSEEGLKKVLDNYPREFVNIINDGVILSDDMVAKAIEDTKDNLKSVLCEINLNVKEIPSLVAKAIIEYNPSSINRYIHLLKYTMDEILDINFIAGWYMSSFFNVAALSIDTVNNFSNKELFWLFITSKDTVNIYLDKYSDEVKRKYRSFNMYCTLDNDITKEKDLSIRSPYMEYRPSLEVYYTAYTTIFTSNDN